MHFACNQVAWYATAADKLLFHTLMAGAGMPRPELLAVTQGSRMVPDGHLARRGGCNKRTVPAGHRQLVLRRPARVPARTLLEGVTGTAQQRLRGVRSD